MTREFIPYKQSLALKELGFDEPCIGYYNKETNWGLCWSSNSIQPYNHNNPEKYGNISAPLYQQAFRWFREKYGLVGLIDIGSQEFSYDVYNTNEDVSELGLSKISYNGTHEEAELACLNKLIELVKQNSYDTRSKIVRSYVR